MKKDELHEETTPAESRLVIKDKKSLILFVFIVIGIFLFAFIVNTIEGKMPFGAFLILFLLLLALFCCVYTKIKAKEEIVANLDENYLYYSNSTLRKETEGGDKIQIDQIKKGYIVYGTNGTKGENGYEYTSDVCFLMKDGQTKKFLSDIKEREKLHEIRTFLSQYVPFDDEYQMGECFEQNEGNTAEAKDNLKKIAKEEIEGEPEKINILRKGANRRKGKDGEVEINADLIDDNIENMDETNDKRKKRPVLYPKPVPKGITMRMEEEENEP